jgi:beta-galactosidase
MKKHLICCLFILFILCNNVMMSQNHQDIIMLNGMTDYEQTEFAFPPEKFTHKIPVPGLVDLAGPKYDQYDRYFSGRQDLKYHWYRYKFKVPAIYENRFATLVLLKSMFNTQIYLNGYDCGTFMQCSTPIETNLTPYLKSGNEENILLIRVDEEKRISRESAMGFDREKFAYIPGIWDDVFITFTGPVRLARTLVLTDYSAKEVTIKLKIVNVSKIYQRNMEYAYADYTVKGYLKEKNSGKRVTGDFMVHGRLKSQLEDRQIIIVPVADPVAWSPENPFLYELVLKAVCDSITIDEYGNPENLKSHYPASLTGPSDAVTVNVGIRDFKAVSDHFSLNGERYFLTGSTITLNRFFEDRDRKDLPWDRKWVEEMFVRIPKSLGWNTFRICIGLLPSFWYDLADQYGILLQNEYPMWQYRGSDSEIEKEYTDWVWSDGSHPSIVIWDALNEQKSDFIGNRLIPELLKVDPTRIWDAGYMTARDMKVQMKEDHPYRLGFGWWDTDKSIGEQRQKFTFGILGPAETRHHSDVPRLVNEYGWFWLTRDGRESSIRTNGEFLPGQETPYTDNYEYFEPGGKELYHNRDLSKYFLGDSATSEERIHFQAYYVAIEAETLRASKSYAGILSFVYLTNNRGYTGDWWLGDVADLKPSQTLLMQYNISKLFGVYINHEDQRYNRNGGYYNPSAASSISLFATNESDKVRSGRVALKCIDHKGQTALLKEIDIELEPFSYKMITADVRIPHEEGGYMLVTELTDKDADPSDLKQISRRYIRVGRSANPVFYDYQYLFSTRWPE